MLTAWGYEVDGSIPPLLSVEAFTTMTGGKYDAVQSALALQAASQAVRTACGWHIAPSLECTARLTCEGKLAQLPANFVTEVASVTEDGEPLSSGQYEWRRDGLLRRACFANWTPTWGGVVVAYTAGLDADAAPDLAHAVLGIAEGVMAVSAGVASESADGVSISYSASAGSVAAALTDQQRLALAPYRLVSSHAA